MLSAAGLIDQVAQPSGQLDGKIVFTSAGHGWEWFSSPTFNGFYAGREEFQDTEVNEAFGNQDQMTFYADYLLRAGATVVPMRPVGDQLNEVVLDNDSPGVTYSGSWSNSTNSVYYDEDYGASADSVSYRFSSIASTETAVATYTPDIPEQGFYPIYTWVNDSSNRTNQLYRINHSDGGLTEIRVDHRKVGRGWVYLGTYHFDTGTGGNVQISNQSTDGGSVVIADAIRFGNGLGDMLDGPSGIGHPSGSVTGQPREDEASLLWTWRAIGQGTSPAAVIGTSNVSAPHRMAEHMNNNANAFGDSVYIGFHSNASGNHTARGAIGLWNASPSERTPNQEDLALFTGRQINQDMQALNGQFEHNWSTRTSHETNFQNFGEIDGGPSAEMDMTIIEVAFHDETLDAELLRDPKVRDQLARSTYEATLEYFDAHGGLSTPVSQPSKPIDVTATTNANGDITVSWAPGPTGVQGGTPSGYRIYVSNNGLSYAGYVEASGAGAGSHTFLASELGDDGYYFKVVAVNSGGESPASAVVGASKSLASDPRVLIVDGFDRNDRTQNERYPDPFSGDPDGLDLVDRVRTRYNNSFDYAIQYGVEFDAADLGFNTVQNESIISGAVSLLDYDAVFWFSGEESTADDTFNATEQTLVSNYLTSGGQLFVSGAEIGWDLDNLGNGVSFYNNDLRADYDSDDAGTYDVQGASGSIFEGLSFSFDDGSEFYDVNFPDVISPLGGATTALNYVGGTGGGAAIQYDSGTSTKVVNFGFPFETITDPADRSTVMSRVLDFFDFDLTFSDVELILDNDDGAPVYSETGFWSDAAGTGFNGGTYRFTQSGDPDTAQWNFSLPFAGEGEVFVQYVAAGNRATSAMYEVDTGNGVETVSIDQTANSLTWVSLGTFDFTAGAHSVTLNAQTSTGGSVVIADAVRVFVPAPAVDNADFDQNSRVDALDFLAWQRGIGTTGSATLADGDANDDGNVDGADLAIWENQYGTSSAVASVQSQSVPVFASLSTDQPTERFEHEAEQPNSPLPLSPSSSSDSAIADVVRLLTASATADDKSSYFAKRPVLQEDFWADLTERFVDSRFQTVDNSLSIDSSRPQYAGREIGSAFDEVLSTFGESLQRNQLEVVLTKLNL